MYDSYSQQLRKWAFAESLLTLWPMKLQTMQRDIYNAPRPLPPDEHYLLSAIQLILGSDSDTRGTVASLSYLGHSESTYAHGASIRRLLNYCNHLSAIAFIVPEGFGLGRSTVRRITDEEQVYLVEHYRTTRPDAYVQLQWAPDVSDINANFVYSFAKFYDSITMNNRRITPSDSLHSASGSIVQALWNSVTYVGQVVNIIGHQQNGIHVDDEYPGVLLQVRWFSPLRRVGANPWAA